MTHRFLRISLASTLAIVLATPAWAQESGTDTSGDIIVTARRIEEKLQDVPISMTVLNQEQLDQHNIVSTADLGSFVPSLSVNEQFGPEKASFVIRGFTQAYHTAPTVGVYFADVIAPRALGPTTSGNGAGVGSTFDLENIQVLKGPQGTLFGRNTTGGAILLVPHKPTDKFEGYVEGTVGAYNEHRLQAVVNVPLSDTFKIRAGVDYNKQDGYVHNLSGVGPKDFDNTNYIAGRLSALWNVTPDLENYTVFSYSHSRTHGDTPKNVTCTDQKGLTAFQENPNPVTNFLNFALDPYACAQIARQNARGDSIWDVENNDPNPLELIEQWSAINTTTWRAGDTLTIKNIASYSAYHESANFNLWGDNFLRDPTIPPGLATPFGSPLAGTDLSKGVLLSKLITLEQGFYPWTTAESTFTDELQFQGHTSDGRFTWQAGAYFEASKPLGFNAQLVEDFTNCSNAQQIVCTNPLGFGSLSDANTKDWFNDKALYAQATYKLTDQLALTGGIRYTWDKQTDLAESLNVSPSGPAAGTLTCQNIFLFHKPIPPGTNPTPADVLVVNSASQCDVTRMISSSRPTWLIDLDYKPNQDMLFYIKWARGYRMGAINSNSVGFETTGPEKLDLYEVGAKTSFRGAVSGYFNIAGFYNDFHNQQISINPVLNSAYQGVLTNSSPTINAGHSRIWGVEVDSSFNLFQGFKLDVGYTYLNTKVLQITLPTPPIYYAALNSTAGQGDPLALSPANTVVVTGTYRLPLAENVGRVSIGATFTHADANRAESPLASPVYLISAENQLNLNADWRGIFGSPIDLSFYMTNATNQGRILFPSSAFQTIGIDGGHVNQPRMWGFRLKYHFGD